METFCPAWQNGQANLSFEVRHHFTRRRRGRARASVHQLGLLGFGGPAAHVALSARRGGPAPGVDERRGVSRAGRGGEPAPRSQLVRRARHSHRPQQAGTAGCVAGVCFILPSMLLVLAGAWAYVRYEQPRRAQLPPADVNGELGQGGAGEQVHRPDQVEKLLVVHPRPARFDHLVAHRARRGPPNPRFDFGEQTRELARAAGRVK